MIKEILINFVRVIGLIGGVIGLVIAVGLTFKRKQKEREE